VRILIVTPAPAGSRLGNRISALRWARLLKRQGLTVSIAQDYRGQRCDLMIALHAVKSGPALRRFRKEHPGAPLVLVLTGTDLYQDLRRRRTRQSVLRSMALADRIVTLNEEAVRLVPARHRPKVRCILQSAPAARAGSGRFPFAGERPLIVSIVGHLRAEKDPLRPAYAGRRLPQSSRILFLQAGAALRPAWARRAEAEMRRNPRYLWLGELDAGQVRRLLARSDLLVHPSRMEGGANTITEAVRAGVPVLASRIPGNIGLLGRRYSGYFTLGSASALAGLLLRIERDPAFLMRLRKDGRRLALRFDPRREALGWRRLMNELVAP